jgi:transposase-like protein
VVVLNPQRTRERYKCKGCNHHICDKCAAEMVAGASCRTFAQFVEEELEKVERQATSGLILP